jgi:hypothetical protein
MQSKESQHVVVHLIQLQEAWSDAPKGVGRGEGELEGPAHQESAEDAASCKGRVCDMSLLLTP